MSGLEVCETLRAARVRLTILMLTALGSTEDHVSGLRIKALGRRSQMLLDASDRVLKVGDLELCRDAVQVRRGWRDIAMTAREIVVLEMLMMAS